MANEWSITYTLTHSKKVLIKAYLIIWSDYSTSFKDLMFLSFHRVQKNHKGQTSKHFSVLSPQDLYQLGRVPLTVEWSTHATLKKEKTRYHRILALGQQQSMWSTNSSSLHKKHPLGIIHLLLLSWSIVKILPLAAFKAKKPTFVEA